MIRKPAGDWGRESPVVGVTRDLAASGVAVAKKGGYYARGAIMLAFAAIWGLAALAGGVMMHSQPMAIGVGLMAALAAWGGVHSLAKARAIAPDDTATPIGAPGWAGGLGGTTGRVCYGRSRLLTRAWIAGAVAIMAAWALTQGHGRGSGLGFALAVIGTPAAAALALLCGAKAFGDLTALEWDGQGLTIVTLFRRQRLHWGSVSQIGVRKRTVRMFYGLIPVSSTDILTIRHGAGALLSSRVSISRDLLDLEGRSIYYLVAQLEEAQRQPWRAPVAAPAGVAPPAASAGDPAVASGAGFDPDAIIARYMAQKAADEAHAAAAAMPPPPPGPPRRGQFGRKGMAA